MHTGEDDISLLGKISTWNYATSTSAFPGECGRVRGSSDGLFAPGTLAMRDNFEIWSTDICRTIQFQRLVRNISLKLLCLTFGSLYFANIT